MPSKKRNWMRIGEVEKAATEKYSHITLKQGRFEHMVLVSGQDDCSFMCFDNAFLENWPIPGPSRTKWVVVVTEHRGIHVFDIDSYWIREVKVVKYGS